MMNERIRELWRQCVVKHTKTPMNWQMVADEFAELIVIECASICYNSGLEDSDAHAMNLMFDFNIDNCRNDK